MASGGVVSDVGSVLMERVAVDVLQARQVPMSSEGAVFVTVKCREHSAHTAAVVRQITPCWKDESHTFATTGTDALVVQLWDECSTAEPIGQVTIPIQELEARVVEQWYVLEGDSGTELLLRTRWERSRVPRPPAKPAKRVFQVTSAKASGPIKADEVEVKIVSGNECITSRGRPSTELSFSSGSLPVTSKIEITVLDAGSGSLIASGVLPDLGVLIKDEANTIDIVCSATIAIQLVIVPDFGLPPLVPKPALSISYDVAMHKACANCGLTIDDLTPRSVDHFRKKDEPTALTQARFEQHQALLIKRLHAVVTERQRLLSDAAKQDGAHRSSTSSPAQDELLMQRAHRQRQLWDTREERVRSIRQSRTKTKLNNVERAVEIAERARKEREEYQAQLATLHRANQEQMRKRYARDEQLATLRQRRVEEEMHKKLASLAEHETELEKARDRRQAQLVELAGASSEDNTIARLERAKAERQRVDDEISSKTQRTLQTAENRRERHARRQFMKQVDLANKALAERKAIEERITRSNHITESHQTTAATRLAEVQARSARLLATRDADNRAVMSAAAKHREEHHEGAKQRRTARTLEAQRQRQEREVQERQSEAHRREREQVDEKLKAEVVSAKQHHQAEVITRVNHQCVLQQQQQRERLAARQRAADDRLQKLNDIRAVLQA
jgi:hypothetical protein